MLDVIIIGAGPAGLSAALILGRCRRHVLVCDTSHPRNAASQALHGFLSRDGIPPRELRELGREQLHRSGTVELRQVKVTDAVKRDGGFEVTLGDGSRLCCRKLLLATGVVDNLPKIPGFEELYGRSVFHCPYCDGWEVRDQPLAIYGKGDLGRGLALELTAWSRELVLCTDGPGDLSFEDLARLARNGITVREEPIARLEGKDGILERIAFTNGDVLPRRALFFNTGEYEQSELPAKLGCDFTSHGTVRTGEYEATNVPNLYVAGDASRRVQVVIVAAAEGAEAAFAINTALLRGELA